MSDDPHNDALRDASGSIVSDSRVVCFLYSLMRDHLPVGVLERLVRETEEQPLTYTNGWLALYAQNLALRLFPRGVALPAVKGAFKGYVPGSTADGEPCLVCVSSRDDGSLILTLLDGLSPEPERDLSLSISLSPEATLRLGTLIKG